MSSSVVTDDLYCSCCVSTHLCVPVFVYQTQFFLKASLWEKQNTTPKPTDGPQWPNTKNLTFPDMVLITPFWHICVSGFRYLSGPPVKSYLLTLMLASNIPKQIIDWFTLVLIEIEQKPISLIYDMFWWTFPTQKSYVFWLRNDTTRSSIW